MASQSSIEWTEVTWNPVTGCTKISSGCKYCYVNSMSDLFHSEVTLEYIQQVFEVMNTTPHIYQVLTKRSERLQEISAFLNWTDNIWMGVSVESELMTKRIPHLINTEAKTKFLSIEPLIRPVKTMYLEQIDWVIVGCESGPKARPIKKEWIDFIKKECERTSTPFFFKQWGKRDFNIDKKDPTIQSTHISHAKGGCQLDGEIYRQMPGQTLLVK